MELQRNRGLRSVPHCFHEIELPSFHVPSVLSIESDLNTVFNTQIEYIFKTNNELSRRNVPPICTLRLISSSQEVLESVKSYIDAAIQPEIICEIKTEGTGILNNIWKEENEIKRRFGVHILFKGSVFLIKGRYDTVNAAFFYIDKICNNHWSAKNQLLNEVVFHNCSNGVDSLIHLLSKDFSSVLNNNSGGKTTEEHVLNAPSDSDCDEVSQKLSGMNVDGLDEDEHSDETDSEDSGRKASLLEHINKFNTEASGPLTKDVCLLKRKLKKKTRRPIVIDGLNVTYDDTSPSKRNLRKLLAVVKFFIQLNFTDIKVVYPAWMHFYDDMGFLQFLKESNMVAYCPTRHGSQYDDDVYILTLALRKGACIVSNDQYRQYIDIGNGIYKELIEKSVLPFMLVDNIFIPADPPSGKNGIPLCDFLTTTSNDQNAKSSSTDENSEKLSNNFQGKK